MEGEKNPEMPIYGYERAFFLDAEIDQEAECYDPDLYTDESIRAVYREFLIAAKDHAFRGWLRYEVRDGAKTLESHGVSIVGRLLRDIVIEAYHVFQLVRPLEE